jgi:hypothetical protein
MATIDEDKLNLEIRKFLKQVGITSQREIEAAVRAAADQGALPAGGVEANVTLELPALGVSHVVSQRLDLG